MEEASSNPPTHILGPITRATRIRLNIPLNSPLLGAESVDGEVSELEDEEQSVASSFAEIMSARMNEHSYMTKMVDDTIQEGRELEKAFRMAKVSVLTMFVAGTEPKVGKQLNGAIRTRQSTAIYDDVIARGDLAQYLRWLSLEINSKGRPDLHPNVSYHKFVASLHKACIWHAK